MNFQRIGILTILAVFLLIFVGGVVRSTGSGMGCPDWPKCFGLWVPPTSVDQLPLNYQEIYGAKLKGEVLFNPVKTWIEYLNRILGAIIGLLVTLNFLASLHYWKKKRTVTIWAFSAVILTGFQGWIGSKVVSSELATYLVSIHMLIAIFIVLILINSLVLSDFKQKNAEYLNSKVFRFILLVCFITFCQVILGTLVREKIDIVSHQLGESLRVNWVESVGLKFMVHRSFSILVLVLHLFLFKYLNDIYKSGFFKNLNRGLLLIILLEICTGISLNYLGFPAFLQPVHLTLAIVSLGLQAFLVFSFLKVNNRVKI